MGTPRRLIFLGIAAAATLPVLYLRRADDIATTSTATGTGAAQEAEAVVESFESLLGKLVVEVEAGAEFVSKEELFLAVELGLERMPAKADASDTAISKRAMDLILSSEVSSPALYERLYTHPVWPRGKSGVTVGVGYDVGYVTADVLKEDWIKYIAPDDARKLSVACGEKGQSASELVSRLNDVSVNWDAAVNQFTEQMLPRYIGITERALPHSNLLSPDSLGALVSLVYNRGAVFDISPEKDKDGRYEEMRHILTHMTNKEFARIPGEIRAMKRLWDNKGLLLRRDAEAALFESGLKA